MGYYSSVGILIEEKEYGKMFEAAKEKQVEYILKKSWDREYTSFYENLTNLLCEYSTVNKKIDYGGDFHVIYYDSIKWYSEDLTVSFIESYIKNLEHYQFIRIGEDSDDYEEEGTEYYFSIERRITTEDGML